MIDLSQVTDIMLGNETVTQIEDSLGNVLWSATPPPNYFYVEDASGSDNTLTIKKVGTAPTIEVFVSTDQQNWTSIGNPTTEGITTTIPANSKLYLKCNTSRWASNTSKYNYITVSGNHNIGGNIMSLLYGDNFDGQTEFSSGFTFNRLFYNNIKLINTQDLVLPATTLAQSCYYNMFQGCTSLTTAPVLPATTLAVGCYNGIFNGCSSLATAPALPATTLGGSCYQNMFWGCTSLTTAPALPATTLAANCYQSMFTNCTNLNSVTTYADDISASNCLNTWLSNVSATGDFYNLGSATYTSGDSGIPSGWTEHNSL